MKGQLTSVNVTLSANTEQFESKMNRAKRIIRGFGEEAFNSTQDVIKGFLGMGASIVILQRSLEGLRKLTGTIKDFTDYERKLSEINSLLIGGADNIDKYSDKILKLSNSFGILPTEQAMGYYQAVSAGFTSVGQATKVMQAANTAAIAGMAQTPNVIKAISAAIKAYGKDANDAMSIADDLMTSVRKGILRMDELTSGVGKLFPLGKQLSFSSKSILAAVTSITQLGIPAEEAITQLSSLMAAVMRSRPEVRKFAKEVLGMDFSAAKARELGLPNFLLYIWRATKGNEQAIAKLLGRKEAILGFYSLLANQGKVYRKTLLEFKNNQGEAQKAFENMTKSAWFQLQKLKVAFSTFKIYVGQAMFILVAPIAKVLGAFIQWLNTLKETHPVVFKMIVGITALTTAMTSLIFAVTALRMGWLFMKGTMLETLNFLKIWVAESSVAFATNPIIWVILGIAGALYALKKAYDTNFLGMRNDLGELFNIVKNIFGFIKNVFIEIWNTLKPIRDAFKEMSKYLYTLFKPIIPALKMGLKLLIYFVAFMLGGVTVAIMGAIGIVLLAITTIGVLFGVLIKGFIAIGQWLGKTAAKIYLWFKKLGKHLKDFGRLITEFGKWLYDITIGAIIRTVRAIISKFSSMWSSITHTAINFGHNIKNAFISIGNAIIKPFKIVFDWIKQKFDALMQWIRNARDYVASLWDDIKSLPGRIVNKLSFGLVRVDTGGGGMTPQDEVDRQIEESRKQNSIITPQAPTLTAQAFSPSNQQQYNSNKEMSINVSVPEPKVILHANLKVDGKQLATIANKYQKVISEEKLTTVKPIMGAS